MNAIALKSLLLVAVFLPAAVCAQEADLEKGREINFTCAGCHGADGRGGKRGEYPRIAGQRASYLEDQLRSFRSRRRPNIPMVPYTEERELPDEDIKAVSAYLASIKLSTKPPTFKGDEDALTRLLAMEQVMIIPRAEGSVDNGKLHYQAHCANCHAKDGMGRSDFPMLVGQYTNYLKRQMDAYRKKERPHDEDRPGGILDQFSEQDLQDMLAYLTSIQPQE